MRPYRLRPMQVCKAAPIPGETKIWQYITLMKRIFCIDCPGVVYNKTSDGESDLVLKGVVRVENLEDASQHVAPVLARVKPEYLVSEMPSSLPPPAPPWACICAHASARMPHPPACRNACKMARWEWWRARQHWALMNFRSDSR